MRIGIDCRMYSTAFTGIGRYTQELTNHLFSLDSKNEYVLFFNHPQFDKFEPPHDRVRKILVNSPHYSIQEQTTFLFHLYREKLDLMHFTHFNAPLLYARPSIVTIHDLTLSFFPGKKMTSFLHRLGYNLILGKTVKRAKKVITVSENTKKDLQRFFHVPSDKIEVIYCGVDQKFRPIEDQKFLQSVQQKYHIDKTFLLYTGVWRNHKNLPNLLRAFSLLRKRYKFQGYLVITGREDPFYASEIKNLISELELKQHVILTGLVDEQDLIALYNATEAYVFPSLYEGFGLPSLEAMRCGTPVVASNISSIPEICGEGNALFFDPYDPKDMAEKMNLIITDKILRQQLIENGFTRAQQFSWRKMAQEILKLYQFDDIATPV